MVSSGGILRIRWWFAARGWAGPSLTLCAVVAACQSAPPPPQPTRLSRHVEQLLDDPTGLPHVALPTEVSPSQDVTPSAEATAVAAPQGATLADVQAPATGPGAAAPSQGASAKAAEPDAADKAKDDKAGRPAKADKSDRPDPGNRTAKADKTEKAEKPEKPEKAGKDSGDDVTVPEGADATDLYYSGKRKLDSGDLPGAIADLRASNKVRMSVRTLTLLGRAYFDAGQLSAAEKAFKAAGTYDEAMLLLGQLYQQSGKQAAARKVYEKFLQVHTDHPKTEWVRKLLQAI